MSRALAVWRSTTFDNSRWAREVDGVTTHSAVFAGINAKGCAVWILTSGTESRELPSFAACKRAAK